MFLKNLDGTWYDDTECDRNNSMITFHIDSSNYNKLMRIAHESGIMTFDIGKIINLVIEKYPSNLNLKD